MKLLTINPGSTSAKYSLFDDQKLITVGQFRKKEANFTFDDQEISEKEFQKSFAYFIQHLIDQNHLRSLEEIQKIGIRIVHGGNRFQSPTLIDNQVFEELKELSVLAPLHNPPALKIIKQIWDQTRDVEIYGIFDTAFHTTIPEVAKTYAIPKDLAESHQIQKYGFHGIACQSVLHQVKKDLGKLPPNIIICHLGGGASITAVKNGESIDTSMGFTPLEGIMMISRSGDLDPGIMNYLEKNAGLSGEEVLEILNKKSGIKGITDTDDMKLVVEKAEAGDQICKLAVEMFVYRIVKYIFAYYGVLQGLDLITFSGGIGVGSEPIRDKITEKLKILGFPEDKKIMVVEVAENVEMARAIS